MFLFTTCRRPICCRVLFPALFALLTSSAPLFAQPSAAVPPAAAPAPDPFDAGAVVPRAKYRSTFEGYRPLTEEKVGPWRAANENVGRIGGWRVYAREAEPVPSAAPSAAPSPGSVPATAPGGASRGHQHH